MLGSVRHPVVAVWRLENHESATAIVSAMAPDDQDRTARTHVDATREKTVRKPVIVISRGVRAAASGRVSETWRRVSPLSSARPPPSAAARRLDDDLDVT